MPNTIISSVEQTESDPSSLTEREEVGDGPILDLVQAAWEEQGVPGLRSAAQQKRNVADFHEVCCNQRLAAVGREDLGGKELTDRRGCRVDRRRRTQSRQVGFPGPREFRGRGERL